MRANDRTGVRTASHEELKTLCVIRNRTNTHGGFILLMTLCVIMVMSTLSLTILHHLLLYHKAVNQQEALQQRVSQLEYHATQLAATWVTHSNCMQGGDDANGIIEQLQKGHGCVLSDGQAHYQYEIEELGDFPCLILDDQGEKRSTHHIRLTILLLADEEYDASVLQIRVIMPSVAIASCNGAEHVISQGISSWRFLPTV